MDRTALQTATHVLEMADSPLGDSHLYKSSAHRYKESVLFIVRIDSEKRLVVVTENSDESFEDFSGYRFQSADYYGVVGPLNRENAEAIRKRFEFTKPVLIGKTDSYGLGDRLGNAGCAHLRAIRNSGFKPVLAQQSVRELERTSRTANDVMDAALWSVFQEGYHGGFGADGDHLKTEAHLDMMVQAGYTMFTIDPSDYVRDDAADLGDKDLDSEYQTLPWDDLDESPDQLLNRFNNKQIELPDSYILDASERDVREGMVKYGRVIVHTIQMAQYLTDTYPDHPVELELSVDETEKPTTLFEHYLIASELDRLGVELVSLAPRFCGDFEKGIDFKGDLEQFREEYTHHLAIAEKFGGYKLSIHSGSDKFSVYRVVGSIKQGAIHVKTAGTSYLEALRAVAARDENLFREILHFSLGRFHTDKKTYHISADLNRVPDPDSLSGKDLVALLDDNHVRQVLHVTYGSVLSGVDTRPEGFKQEVMSLLSRNEETYEDFLERHFHKHISPFSGE